MNRTCLQFKKLHSYELYFNELYSTAFICTTPKKTLYCPEMIALHFTSVHCTELHCTSQHCTVLNCIALHYIALHCIVLNCIAVYCIALCSSHTPVYQEVLNRSHLPHLTLDYKPLTISRYSVVIL